MSEITIIERGEAAAHSWRGRMEKDVRVWLASNDLRPKFYRIMSVCPSSGNELETCSQCGSSRQVIVTTVELREING